MAMRDECCDTDRTGRTAHNRAAHMSEVNMAPATPASDKAMFPDSLNATRGASDIGEIRPG